MTFPLARTGPTRFALQAWLGIPSAIAMCALAAAILFWPAAAQTTRDLIGVILMAAYLVSALVIGHWLRRGDAPDGVYWAGLALGTPAWLALVYFGVLR